MGKIRDLFQEIFPLKIVVVKQENNNGNANFNGNEIANTINNNIWVADRKQIEEVYESVINEGSSIDLREAIIPIEDLINEGKFNLAIQKYEELISSAQFIRYSKDEKFLVYNGLLNCHINNVATDEIINHWKVKLKLWEQV